MSKFLMASTVAALALGGALASAPAQAQVGIEIGPGGVRVGERDRVIERRVIERERPRVVERRRVIVEDEPECRTEIRRRTNRFGERVTSRVRVCD